jgi:hypothetical protein
MMDANDKTPPLSEDEHLTTKLSSEHSDDHPRLERQNSVDSGHPLSPQLPSTPEGSASMDLPLPLLQAGWRKMWSRRESRPYFFNKNDGRSLWEQPNVEDVSDILKIIIFIIVWHVSCVPHVAYFVWHIYLLNKGNVFLEIWH